MIFLQPSTHFYPKNREPLKQISIPIKCFSFFHFYKLKKTYPVAQKYKYPYHLMQKYYSVHLVPLGKGKKKDTDQRKKIHIFTERGSFFPLCVLKVAPHGIYLILQLLAHAQLYITEPIFPEESHLITAQREIFWTKSTWGQKPQTSLTYQFVLPDVLWVGLTVVWHFWVHHAEPGK